MREAELWTDTYGIRCFGWEAVSYRGMVWRAVRGLWNQTSQVHCALGPLRLGDVRGAISGPWFLICKGGGHQVCESAVSIYGSGHGQV